MKRRFKQVQPALAFAATHLDQDVRLADLGAEAAMSPFHLHRVFSAVADETPKQFTLRLRLGHAAALLLAGNDSVLRVALACGFESHEGFTRAFRRRFGMTPSAYRARGFAAGATAEQASHHQQLVNRLGPCVGLFHLREDGTRPRNSMTYSITRKAVSPQPVLVERRRVKQSEISATIGDVVGRIFQYAQQEGIALTGNPFTRYYDVGPGLMTIEPGIRVAASDESPAEGEPTTAGSSDEAGVRRDTLPGGSVASTIHAGPYETLRDAYAALETWIESEGLTTSGAPWESYLTDPANHPDPKDWKTEICWPVQ